MRIEMPNSSELLTLIENEYTKARGEALDAFPRATFSDWEFVSFPARTLLLLIYSAGIHKGLSLVEETCAKEEAKDNADNPSN